MPTREINLPEVFSVREVARAAGVPVSTVEAAIAAGGAHTIRGDYLAKREALRVGTALRAGTPLSALTFGTGILESGPRLREPLFTSHQTRPRVAGLPAMASTALHVLAVAALTWMTSLGIGRPEARTSAPRLDTSRLVFLNLPGPGGGGGGGGLRQPQPTPKAKRAGRSAVSSPLPPREPPPPVEPPPMVERPAVPEIEPEPLPPVIAPVATKPADADSHAGRIDETPATEDSRGAGDLGGVGTGQGSGLGQGRGSGIGDGSDGGTGGGPYRPGSGIQPPRLLREVKAGYTEEARRRGLQGNVELEIVVRADGTVGAVTVLRALGSGLDDRAVAAVKQWRFSPATRMGQPVDVVVGVAVEFKLR